MLRRARNDGAEHPVSRPRTVSIRQGLAIASLAVWLAGCSASLGPPNPPAAGLTAPVASEASYVPSDEPYRLGAEHFNRGEYGLSEHYFRDAVEKAPKDTAAWIGLAASYDRMRRFDLADRAYAAAIRLSGETARILNNQGYSYLLRGNFSAAKAKLAKARALEPDNPNILNNLKLLDSSTQYLRRSAL